MSRVNPNHVWRGALVLGQRIGHTADHLWIRHHVVDHRAYFGHALDEHARDQPLRLGPHPPAQTDLISVHVDIDLCVRGAQGLVVPERAANARVQLLFTPFECAFWSAYHPAQLIWPPAVCETPMP